MARMKRARKGEVQKFGGVEQIGNVRAEDTRREAVGGEVPYDVQSIETESKTKLEQDEGHGTPVVVRNYEFKISPDVLTRFVLERNSYPGKQDLFDSVVKYIEISLWQDGLQVFPKVEPRVMVDKHYRSFQVFVGATPAKGSLLHDAPKTLKEIAHG